MPIAGGSILTIQIARVRLAALLTASLLALSGCAESRVAENAAFNEADLNFVEQMIPHHEQAVQISQLAENRAEDEEVRTIASDIAFIQAIELEELQGWLIEWGFDGAEHSHEDHADAAGMLSADEVQQLEASSGSEFDALFTQLMIQHHEGAIAAARELLETGKSEDIRFFAQSLIESQGAELEQLRFILELLSPAEESE